MPGQSAHAFLEGWPLGSYTEVIKHKKRAKLPNASLKPRQMSNMSPIPRQGPKLLGSRGFMDLCAWLNIFNLDTFGLKQRAAKRQRLGGRWHSSVHGPTSA